ncbi:hypothetical protein [Vulcanisaeta souniana]|uniref:hypothetical protein n=1 Tax=Vulcanisaeta souniana TaxID=164452 RepID=UPI001E5E2EB6|nr:hypothetical protein [Vulcanisaeta souniana]
MHGKVMNMFMGNQCYDVDPPLVMDCVKNALTSIGLNVEEIMFFDIDGNVSQDIDNARYVRAVATSNEINGKQIFTFALIKYRGKYKVLYLQSAVEER